MVDISKEEYPQALPMSESEIEEFLILPNIAVISSHNSNKTIHSTLIYFKYLPEHETVEMGS